MPRDASLRPARPRAGPADDRTPDRLAVDLAIRLGFLALFAFFAFSLLRPFLPILLWSAVLTVAFYPAHAWAAKRIGAGPASAAITIAGLAVVLGPTTILLSSLIRSLEHLARQFASGRPDLPPPSPALTELPVIGPHLAAAWTLASENLETFLARYGKALLGAGEWMLRAVEHLAGSVVVVLAAVVVAGFLYVPGPRLLEAVRRFVVRLAGGRGAGFVDLAGATIRNVARGVVGISIVQALLVGVALIVAGVPAAGMLTLAVLVLAIVQVGAWPVVLGVLAWGWLHLETVPALLLTLYLLPIMVLDALLKPFVMGKGLPTPTFVIVAGVIGGTLAYGLIGLFVGPVVLAVGYELLVLWVRSGAREADAPGGIE
jgi:predicted PurR-regulated permease PerM